MGEKIKMETIRKLPFVLGVLAAIVIGTIGILYGKPLNYVYTEMAVGMFVFLIVGLFARSTIEKIHQEVLERKLLEHKKLAEAEALRKLEEEANAQNTNTKNVIDYRIDDDFEDGFEPFKFQETFGTKNDG